MSISSFFHGAVTTLNRNFGSTPSHTWSCIAPQQSFRIKKQLKTRRVMVQIELPAKICKCMSQVQEYKINYNHIIITWSHMCMIKTYLKKQFCTWPWETAYGFHRSPSSPCGLLWPDAQQRRRSSSRCPIRRAPEPRLGHLGCGKNLPLGRYGWMVS